MASWLSKLSLCPVYRSIAQGPGFPFPSSEAFVLYFNKTRSEHVAACIHALSPIKKALSTVSGVFARSFVSSTASLSALAGIFSNAQAVTLEIPYFNEDFVEPWYLCVQLMPKLRKLTTDCWWAVRSLTGALLEARDTRSSPFEICVVFDHDHASYDEHTFLVVLADQLECAARLQPLRPPCKVSTVVRQGP